MSTPAERVAKDLVDSIFMSGSQWGEHDWKFAQAAIAQAITQAENDKLEEAALLVQTIVSMPAATFKCAGETLRDQNGDEYFLGPKAVNELIESKAAAIRSLKKD